MLVLADRLFGRSGSKYLMLPNNRCCRPAISKNRVLSPIQLGSCSPSLPGARFFVYVLTSRAVRSKLRALLTRETNAPEQWPPKRCAGAFFY